MSKRWSVNLIRPLLKEMGGFCLIRLAFDWGPSVETLDGWITATAIACGYGVSLTYWRYPKQPDVYGDGGVA